MKFIVYYKYLSSGILSVLGVKCFEFLREDFYCLYLNISGCLNIKDIYK